MSLRTLRRSLAARFSVKTGTEEKNPFNGTIPIPSSLKLEFPNNESQNVDFYQNKKSSIIKENSKPASRNNLGKKSNKKILLPISLQIK